MPILQHVHKLTHWGSENTISWSKQYYKKPPPTSHKVYSRYSICPKYNPGKPLHRSQGHFLFPLGPFTVWQFDFIQIPPSEGCKYISYDLYVLSLDKDILLQESNSLNSRYIFIGKIIPSWGIPSELHSD